MFKSVVMKYNSKYKTLYVNNGAYFEFEGIYKVTETKVTFTGKLLSSNLEVVEKDTGDNIPLPMSDIINFDLYLQDTKVTIKDKEYTFKTFEGFQLIYKYLQHLDITENVPFKGVLNFALNPNWLEILGNGVDDFGNKVAPESIYNLIGDKCPITKIDKLSFDLPESGNNKSYQKASYSEYQRLSDRFKFLCEKLGLSSDTSSLHDIYYTVNNGLSADDYVGMSNFLLLLITK